MSSDRARLYFQKLRQQIAALQTENAAVWQEMNAAFEELYTTYEHMQSSLRDAEAAQGRLLEQSQRVSEDYQHYYDLFQFSPIAYLVADANGLILEANREMAQLLNVPQPYLAGKPLFLYVAEIDRFAFYTKLNQLTHRRETQVWQMHLCPRDSEPFAAEWCVATTCDTSGRVQSLRIGVYDLSKSQQAIVHLIQQQNLQEVQAESSTPALQLPQALDGLQVLVVDDEADIREFITTVLESHGIGVRAVASAAAALKELEQFQPDVLVSDIRMPHGDGYDLIRQIRTLEVAQGGHIPAGAMTAYLEEDREKVLSAGYEAHLHKLAPPIEWVEMVAQLAGRVLSHS
jgi:CheY-like chemotaxis protein